jgi:hypothetical protein
MTDPTPPPGSDPAPPLVPPGWYPDGQGATRWWDGQRWTSHTADHLPAPTTAPTARKSSSAAMWSMLFGAWGLFFTLLGVAIPFFNFFGGPLTVLGLPLALVALRDIHRGAAVGSGMAWTGLVCNGLVWLLWLVVLIGAAAA